MRRLRDATVVRLGQRRRKVRLSENRYGGLHCIPHAYHGRWCCPIHGPLPNTMAESRLFGVKALWTQQPAGSGIMSEVRGPFVQYGRHLGRPILISDTEWVSVTWQDYICPYEQHVIQMSYLTGSMPSIKLVPGDAIHFWTPEIGTEAYPTLRRLLRRLARRRP